MPGKQAKILSEDDLQDLLAYASATRNPIRNRVIVLLSAGFMGYELINTMVGYHQPGKATGFLAESMAKAFDLELPKD